MRLLLIRHADPDYAIDNLTETGKREAQLRAERIAPMPVKDFFVSPLGRAKATAAPTLEKGRTASKGACLAAGVFHPHPPPGCGGHEPDPLGLAARRLAGGHAPALGGTLAGERDPA